MKKSIALALLLPSIVFARTHIGIQNSVPDTTDAPLAVSLNFTDPVPEFSASSMALTNATVSDFSPAGNDRDFSFTLVPIAEGPFGLSIFAGTVGDNNLALGISSVYAPPAPPIEDSASTTEESTPPAQDAPAPSPPSGGGGGGGSGSAGSTLVQNAVVPEASSAPEEAAAPAPDASAAAAPQEGLVLGAQTYRFTVYLARGMDGDDVLNLQKVLINLGFLGKDYAVGHFGPRTEAAVRAYQAARGVPQAGVVGPLTRAALSSEDLSILQ